MPSPRLPAAGPAALWSKEASVAAILSVIRQKPPSSDYLRLSLVRK